MPKRKRGSLSNNIKTLRLKKARASSVKTSEDKPDTGPSCSHHVSDVQMELDANYAPGPLLDRADVDLQAACDRWGVDFVYPRCDSRCSRNEDVSVQFHRRNQLRRACTQKRFQMYKSRMRQDPKLREQRLESERKRVARRRAKIQRDPDLSEQCFQSERERVAQWRKKIQQDPDLSEQRLQSERERVAQWRKKIQQDPDLSVDHLQLERLIHHVSIRQDPPNEVVIERNDDPCVVKEEILESEAYVEPEGMESSCVNEGQDMEFKLEPVEELNPLTNLEIPDESINFVDCASTSGTSSNPVIKSEPNGDSF